jgi:vacuolar-type H+-ATPase subunit H
LATTFSIKDGKITTKPFRVDISGIGLTLGGVTGFDKSIKYDLMVHLPKQLSFVGANELKGTIGGTFDQPKVQLNTIEVAQKAAKDLVDKTLVKAIGTNLSETKAKIQESIDFQAKKIREQAKSAGDRLISEAEKKGAELVEKAKNPLLKAAAKTTAAQLVKEAQKKATQLMSDAENQIKKMATEAQAKAE